MVTNDIILLPLILLTKTDYILWEEIIYTYDKDSEDLSQTGIHKRINVNIMICVTIEVDKCVKRLTFLLI